MKPSIFSRARTWLMEPKTRVTILGAAASLAVAFVRRGMVPWPTIEQFLVAWFVHFCALLVFLLVTYAVILRFSKFFVGYEQKETSFKDQMVEITYYVYMTVFASAIFMMVVMSWSPSDEFD